MQTELGSFVRFAQSSGFTRFSGYVTPILSEYHISEDEYKARASTAWPELTAETVLVTVQNPESKAGAVKPEQSSMNAEPGTHEVDRSIEDRLDGALKP